MRHVTIYAAPAYYRLIAATTRAPLPERQEHFMLMLPFYTAQPCRSPALAHRDTARDVALVLMFFCV